MAHQSILLLQNQIFQLEFAGDQKELKGESSIGFTSLNGERCFGTSGCINKNILFNIYCVTVEQNRTQ